MQLELLNHHHPLDRCRWWTYSRLWPYQRHHAWKPFASATSARWWTSTYADFFEHLCSYGAKGWFDNDHCSRDAVAWCRNARPGHPQRRGRCAGHRAPASSVTRREARPITYAALTITSVGVCVAVVEAAFDDGPVNAIRSIVALLGIPFLRHPHNLASRSILLSSYVSSGICVCWARQCSPPLTD